MNLKDLGQRIQAAREEKKLSQEQLANAIGCSQPALSNYEKGKRRIYLSQLELLAQVLDKPLEYFMSFDRQESLESSASTPNDRRILRVITELYRLTENELTQLEDYLRYLQWKRP